MTTKKLITIGLAVMTTLLVIVILWQFRVIVVFILISLGIAAAIRPLFARLSGRSPVSRLAWIILYLLVFSAFLFLLFFTFDSMMNEVQQVVLIMGVQDKWVLPGWLQNTLFSQVLISRLPPPSAIIATITGSQGKGVLSALLGFTMSIGGVVTGFIQILFLSLYWSINQIHFERLWFSLLPSGQRKQARYIWQTIEVEVGVYIRAEFIQSLLAGTITGLGCWLLGSPYPAILALTVALVCLIPVIGVILAFVPVLVIGLFTSIQLGLLSALFVLVAMIALNVWIKPRLFNHRWENPIVTVMLLIVLVGVLGIAGIIIAPPLSIISQILWSRLINQRGVSSTSSQISELKERQAQVLAAITALEEPPLPLVTNSLQRLTQLLEKAEPILQVNLPADSSQPFSSSPRVTDQTEPVAITHR